MSDKQGNINATGRKEMSQEEKMWVDFVVKNVFDKRILHEMPLPIISLGNPGVVNTISIQTTDKRKFNFRVGFVGSGIAEFGFFISADEYKAITGKYANMNDEALRIMRGKSGETIYYVQFRSRQARDAIMQKMADCHVTLCKDVTLTSAEKMLDQAQQKKQESNILQQQSERS